MARDVSALVAPLSGQSSLPVAPLPCFSTANSIGLGRSVTKGELVALGGDSWGGTNQGVLFVVLQRFPNLKPGDIFTCLIQLIVMGN
jgi:hypothetical protein